MKYSKFSCYNHGRRCAMLMLCLYCISFFSFGCQRSSDDVWNDTKTAGRHVKRGVKSLGGKQSTSRQIKDSSEFDSDDDISNNISSEMSSSHDFVAFEDDPDHVQFGVIGSQNMLAPKETPGDIGSSLPGIASFNDPLHDPELAMIFEPIHFDYNSSLIKESNNIRIIQKIALYLNKHPKLYIFVEGHCDKRGPSAYNFALGANRSNSVRNMLINEGVAQDHIFTISYGKERLLFDEDSEEFQSLNRRCQFKTYEK